MLIYAIITILSAVAAIAIVWLYRTLVTPKRGGRTVSRRPQRAKRLAHLNSSLSTAPVPWGWGQGTQRSSSKRYNGGHAHNPGMAKGRGKDLRGTRHHQTDLQLRMAGAKDKSSLLSTRSVLNGYDLQRNKPLEQNTSSWPYRDDSFGSSLTAGSIPSFRGASKEGGRGQQTSSKRSLSKARKPWGW